MIEKPTIELINNNLTQQNRGRLKKIWCSLVNFKNYVIPDSLQDIDKLGGFSIFDLSNKDFTDNEFTSKPFFKLDIYPKDSKAKLSFREYTDVLYKLDSLKRVVSYNCIYQRVVGEVKRTFIKKYQKEESSFDKSLNEIIKNILSQVKTYEFYSMVEGIDLIDIKCIPFGDVEILKYQDNNMFSFEIKEDEKIFLEPFEDKLCMRCKVLGEHRQAQEVAIRKFSATLNCIRFIICLYGGEILYKNRIKVNFPEKSLMKSSVSFSIDLESNSFIHTRKMADALEKFKITKQMYDECTKYYFLLDIQRIMICEEEKSEWENLIAGAIYWCGEAQNEYNIDVAFFKFWTAIETLIPSSRGDKVTENVLNGSTVLYFYGIIQHDKNDFKAEKKKLQTLYDKRSSIVHNGLTSKIESSDLAQISQYTVDMIINAIFWSHKRYSTIKQVKNCFETLSIKNNLSKDKMKKKLYNRVEQRKRFLMRRLCPYR